MKIAKHIIKKFLYRLSQLAYEYESLQLRKKFHIPASVSFYKASLEGNVVVGDFTYINEGSRLDSGERSRVVVGRHCAIGRYVHITAKTHVLSCPTTDENNPKIRHEEKDVIIGNYVWIGDQATILPGVTIGDYSIIGAHALVKRDVKPFEVVAGVPASHIRFNIEHYRYHDIAPLT